MSLASCQAQWARALAEGAFDEAAAFVAGNGLAPQRRLWVYHNQLRLAWRDALETTYPVVLALTGRRYFRNAARGYGGWHRAPTGNLRDFGAAFADYLEKRPELALYPYLPDVARLEWIRTESVAAAEEPGLPLALLAAIDGQAWAHLRLRLAPSLRLFASPYPVARIFAAASGRVDKQAARKALQQREAAAVVVYRQGRAVTMETLMPANWRWLLALAHGRPLAEAVALGCETAARMDGAFDLRAALAWTFDRQLVTAIDP